MTDIITHWATERGDTHSELPLFLRGTVTADRSARASDPAVG